MNYPTWNDASKLWDRANASTRLSPYLRIALMFAASSLMCAKLKQPLIPDSIGCAIKSKEALLEYRKQQEKKS